METEERSINEYYSLNPKTFGNILSLSFYRDFIDGSGFTEHFFDGNKNAKYNVEFQLGAYNDEKILYLNFIGARDIKMERIEDIESGLLFEISLIREPQIEDLNYFVESENGEISFMCKSFEARIIEKQEPASHLVCIPVKSR